MWLVLLFLIWISRKFGKGPSADDISDWPQSDMASNKPTETSANTASRSRSKALDPPAVVPVPQTIRTLVKFAAAVSILGIISVFVWQIMATSSATNPGAVFDRTATGYRFYNNKPDFSGQVTIVPGGQPVTLAKDESDAGWPLSLTFQIETFDPSSGTVSGTVSAWISTHNHPNLDPAYIPKVIYVNDRPLKLGLEPNLSGVTPPIWSGAAPFVMQAQGSSGSFPSDSYVISDGITVYDGSGTGPHGVADVSLQAGPKMYPYTIKAHKTDNTWELSVIIHRNAREVVWCYLIALAPILLILAMIWQLITRSPRFTIEAGIGILAILPLRQVLVPTDVGALTRVDLILGMELLTIIALVAIAAFRKPRSWSSSTSPIRPAAL